MNNIIAKKVKKTKNFTTYQIMPSDDADAKNFKDVSAEMRASGETIPAVGSIYLSPDFFKFGDTIEITIKNRSKVSTLKTKKKSGKPKRKPKQELCINCIWYETENCGYTGTNFDPEDPAEVCEDYKWN